MPFEFVLDLLHPLEPRIKNMFGVQALYLGDKLYLALRKKDKHPEDNGVWIGTELESHESLKAEFPALCALHTIPIKKWLLIPEVADNFEETVERICELIKKGDERIGVLPKKKKKKTK